MMLLHVIANVYETVLLEAVLLILVNSVIKFYSNNSESLLYYVASL